VLDRNLSRGVFPVARFRIVFISACLLLAAGVGAVALIRPLSGAQPAVATAAPAIGGPFQLVDQDGRPVDQRLLNGKWTAVFFGYTFCPDACPTTLQALAAVQDKLGARAGQFQIVLISIDPARDTPAKLKDYLQTRSFPKGVFGLTGTPAQVARAAKAYGIFYERHGDGPNYLMDHSTITYLMGPDGRFVAPLTLNDSPQAEAARIIKEMRGRT
jgi:protein SCO1/2